MGFLSDVKDSIFGTDAKIHDRSLLSSEQDEELKKLLSQYGTDSIGAGLFEGESSAPLNDVQNLSLAALENRANELAVNPTFGQAEATLQSFLNPDQDSLEQDFKSSIVNPLLENFDEDIAPRVSRRFSDNFFGSDRKEADARANEDLIDSLSVARGQFSQGVRQQQLQALGLVGDVTGAEGNALTQLFNAGTAVREQQQFGIDKDFEQFLANEGIKGQRLELLLRALGISTKENIAEQGREGALSAAASGFGEAAGAAGAAALFSDVRLKHGITFLGEYKGHRIYSWIWNSTAEKLYKLIGHSVGVLAQQIPKEFTITDENGYLKVNYIDLFGGK